MHRARVITCSDAASRGERTDRSGPAVRDILIEAAFEVGPVVIVPDTIDTISAAIVAACDIDHCALVVTTGGTGIGVRDVTPEATELVTHKRIDGFGEWMRAASMSSTPMAALSRSQASVRGSSLVINVPGSPGGATDSLRAVMHLIPHAIELLSRDRVEVHP